MKTLPFSALLPPAISRGRRSLNVARTLSSLMAITSSSSPMATRETRLPSEMATASMTSGQSRSSNDTESEVKLEKDSDGAKDAFWRLAVT